MLSVLELAKKLNFENSLYNYAEIEVLTQPPNALAFCSFVNGPKSFSTRVHLANTLNYIMSADNGDAVDQVLIPPHTILQSVLLLTPDDERRRDRIVRELDTQVLLTFLLSVPSPQAVVGLTQQYFEITD